MKDIETTKELEIEEASLDTSVAAVQQRLASVSPEQSAIDEHVRKTREEHDARSEERSGVLKRTASAAGNAYARQGLNPQDIATAVRAIKDEMPWEKIKLRLREVSATALEAYKPELYRLAALPPGGERILLGPAPKKAS